MDLPFLPSRLWLLTDGLESVHTNTSGKPFLSPWFLFPPGAWERPGHRPHVGSQGFGLFLPFGGYTANLCKDQKGPGCRKSLGAFLPSKGSLVKVSWGWTA